MKSILRPRAATRRSHAKTKRMPTETIQNAAAIPISRKHLADGMPPIFPENNEDSAPSTPRSVARSKEPYHPNALSRPNLEKHEGRRACYEKSCEIMSARQSRRVVVTSLSSVDCSEYAISAPVLIVLGDRWHSGPPSAPGYWNRCGVLDSFGGHPFCLSVAPASRGPRSQDGLYSAWGCRNSAMDSSLDHGGYLTKRRSSGGYLQRSSSPD